MQDSKRDTDFSVSVSVFCEKQTFGLCGRSQGWDDLRGEH